VHELFIKRAMDLLSLQARQLSVIVPDSSNIQGVELEGYAMELKIIEDTPEEIDDSILRRLENLVQALLALREAVIMLVNIATNVR
jgi:hypothetical protein